MAIRPPAQCRDMTEVRAEIDRIDKALVDAIAERFGYVERAWQLKLEARPGGQRALAQPAGVRQGARARRREGAAARPVEALWRQMVGWFIQHEEEKLRDQLESQVAQLICTCRERATRRMPHARCPSISRPCC